MINIFCGYKLLSSMENRNSQYHEAVTAATLTDAAFMLFGES
jgi:hypothetical protein